MYSFFTIYLLLVISFTKILLGVQLPSYIKPCRTVDEECLKLSVQEAISKLAEGDENLVILPLNHLQMSNLTIAKSQTWPSEFFSEINIFDLTENLTVQSVQISLNPCNINLNLQIFNVQFKGRAVFKGKYEGMDTDIADDVKVVLGIFHFPIYTKCEIYKKNELDFLNITNVAVDVYAEHTDIEFGNKENNIYRSLLENPELYVKIDIYWDAFILDIANKIFNNVPLKDIFKD